MRVVESVIGRKAALYSHRPPECRRFEQSCLFALQDRTSRSALFLFGRFSDPKSLAECCMICAALPYIFDDMVRRMRIWRYYYGSGTRCGGSVSWPVAPRILIFDEPTRGIDVGAKHEIYKLMSQMVEAGSSIIMISSEMVELMGMSDRIIVLAKHKKAGELKRGEYSQEKILDIASL